jgi:putative acyl-CoA dehydrogenase
MCDVFLVLAQAPGGLSCFLVERGAGMEFQRLKDKLGTRSLPSSEVEFRGARGRLVGEEGRGVPAIIRMVNHTRLDCLLGAATAMRRGVVEAIHHARHRAAFGARLVDQPAMANVLADLAEALECLGGNGFVEDSGMPLLYRDAPLNSIWEGSGNVAALDVLRAMVREPEGLPAFLEECSLAAGEDRRFDAHLERVRSSVSEVFAGGEPQFSARRVVEDLAVALQASLLVRAAPPAVADAFCAARLAGEGGRVYGTLPAGIDAAAIVERALAA